MKDYVLMLDGSLEPVEECNDEFANAFCGVSDGKVAEDSVVASAFKTKFVASDPVVPEGDYALLPRGAIVCSLLEEYVRRFHARQQAFPLRSPILCDYSLEPVRLDAELSGEGISQVKQGGEDSILRHGSLFTRFSLCSSETLEQEKLPLRMYEVCPSHRGEAEEPCVALRCPRYFQMIDMHSICSDMAQAKEEFHRLHREVHAQARRFSWKLHSSYTVDEQFYAREQEWVKELLGDEARPVLLRGADLRKRRPINIDYHIVGPNGPLEVAAVQIDCGNPERFGLRTRDSIPIAVHLSIVGSLERWIYALLLSTENSPGNSLPVWVAPEQVRILIGGSLDRESVCRLAADYADQGFRVTVDDRSFALEEKFIRAKRALVPCIVTEDLTVFCGSRIRLEDAPEHLKRETERMPNSEASFPRMLSRWPEVFCV